MPEIKKLCGLCQNCTPLMDFHTLSLKGEPTLGRCPYWTSSKSVILSFDHCETNFILKNELSGMTQDIRDKEEEERLKRQRSQDMINEYWKEHTEIKETLLHPKDIKKTKTKKNGKNQ